MEVTLRQSGNKIGLYIEKRLATVWKDKTIEQVVDWIKKNLRGVKIYIAK